MIVPTLCVVLTVLRHCILNWQIGLIGWLDPNKEDYFDYSREWLGRIDHNTVEGMVACFKWKRHISNKWEENKIKTPQDEPTLGS